MKETIIERAKASMLGHSYDGNNIALVYADSCIEKAIDEAMKSAKDEAIKEMYGTACLYSDGSADNMHRYLERMYPDLLPAPSERG